MEQDSIIKLKQRLKPEEIAKIVISELIENTHASPQGLQERVRESLLEAFNESIELKSEITGADKEVLTKEAYEKVAEKLKERNNPYQDVDDDSWKSSPKIRESYVSRAMEGKEPVLCGLLYHLSSEISQGVMESLSELDSEVSKIGTAKAKELRGKYPHLLNPKFRTEPEFLPIKEGIPKETYTRVYKRLAGAEPPSPEYASSYFLCKAALDYYGLGSEKEKPLVLKKA